MLNSSTYNNFSIAMHMNLVNVNYESCMICIFKPIFSFGNTASTVLLYIDKCLVQLAIDVKRVHILVDKSCHSP